MLTNKNSKLDEEGDVDRGGGAARDIRYGSVGEGSTPGSSQHF